VGSGDRAGALSRRNMALVLAQDFGVGPNGGNNDALLSPNVRCSVAHGDAECPQRKAL